MEYFAQRSKFVTSSSNFPCTFIIKSDYPQKITESVSDHACSICWSAKFTRPEIMIVQALAPINIRIPRNARNSVIFVSSILFLLPSSFVCCRIFETISSSMDFIKDSYKLSTLPAGHSLGLPRIILAMVLRAGRSGVGIYTYHFLPHM